jgi:hypothetical protein
MQLRDTQLTVTVFHYKSFLTYSYYPVFDCPKLRGISRGFDNASVLARFVNVATAVILCIVELGILVRSCRAPVLLRINPAGYDVVFNNVPF